MSNANIALVQSLYDAFGRGDIATIVAALTPDVSWHVIGRPSDYPTLGARKGQAAVNEFFRQVGENQEATDFSPRDFHASGELVFVQGHYAWKIRKTGKAVESDWVHIFTLKNGKVSAFREFTDTAKFAEAYRD
jgi:uncharacterized protein